MQSVFSVGGVWPQLPSCFRNAICAQTSVLFRNPIKYPVYKKLLRKFIVSSGACSLIVATSKWQKIVMRTSKKELEDWRENGSEDRDPKCSHYPVKSVVRLMTTKERSSG